ncbi:MAG: pyridoxine 5'-phosphate synthase [Sphingobacteriales bacterium]|nr:MAG: pyridoxine 5'-phosphate synthase [Sphingobacteriales bacterium]
MTRLSVNINKIALLRNSRGANNPDVLRVAKDCEAFGAQGITVHPRPDERHAKYADVVELKKIVTTEFNVEGYPDERFMDLVLSTKPHQVTLVPDPPGALTSNTGWDTKTHLQFLQDVVGKFKEAGIRTSIFLNPEPELIESAAKTGTDRIELYTEPYATNYFTNRDEAILPYIETAKNALNFGLGINAGHDLNRDNLKYFKQNVTGLLEVSIGHALICDAIYLGLHNTIQLYLRELK